MNWIPWECDYVVAGGFKIFRASAFPSREEQDVVVICAPLGEEAKASFMALNEFSQRLWEKHWAVVRFDYSGTGDSEGASMDTGPDDWLRDAETVLEDLQRTTRIRSTILMGLRLGANVASTLANSLASQRKPSGLVLWEPILDLEKYTRHLKWIDRSDRHDSQMDVMGWSLSQQLLERIKHTLSFKPAGEGLSLFVANVSAANRLSKSFIRLRASLPKGCQVMHVRSRPFWELIGQSSCDDLVCETIQWLECHRTEEVCP